MFLRRISLQHFRNIPLATLEFSGPRQFLVGANGQGKTNLLEAAGFITALRSFRTADPRLLVAHGQAEATVVCTVGHEQRGETVLTIKLGLRGREVWTDGERVTRLGGHLGRFPTVAFSSQDQQLVRGAPAGRRRWLDLTLAAMDPAYLQALQGYHRALAGRNALLKRSAPADELAAFERPLAAQGAALMAARAAGLQVLAADLAKSYRSLAGADEPAGFAYAPDLPEPGEAALLARLAAGRARDAHLRTTLAGPHRDDFEFTLQGGPARDFASEGQQRSLVLALRLAQAAYFHQRSGVRPVLLADDVLGELDPGRRRRFWAAIGPETQVIATGTDLPAGAGRPDDADGAGAWQIFQVAKGAFQPEGTA